MTKVLKRYRAAVIAVTAVVSILFGCIVGAVGDTKGLSETVTVTINYYYYDENEVDHMGNSPYRPFVANMRRNSPEIVEKCPTIPGYKPYSLVDVTDPVTGETSREYQYTQSVTLRFDTDNHVYNIFYKPADVTYTIQLMQQNLTDDGYTVGKTIYGVGLTGDKPEEFSDGYRFPDNYSDPTLQGKLLGEAFEGFTLMYYQPEVIASDGHTEFQCYYDRNYYNVSFDLGEGGFGVMPIYAPYGFTLSNNIVGTPTRPGYSFRGWEPELEPMVSQNMTYTAKWEEQVVPVSIIYKTADLKNDSGETTYSYWDHADLVLDEGYVTNRSDYVQGDFPRASDIVNFSKMLEGYTDAAARNFEEAEYFEFDLQTTLERNDLQPVNEDLNGDGTIDEKDVVFTVSGDETTVITLYYSRKSYTLRFAYARQKIGGLDYPCDTNIDTEKQYMLYLARPQKAITANAAAYSQSGTNYHGLSLQATDSGNENVLWSFEQAISGSGEPVPNGYYVYTMVGGERMYLDVFTEGPSNKPVGGLRLTDEAGRQVLYSSKVSAGSQTVMLYKEIGGKKWFVNNVKNNTSIAAVSNYSETDDGNQIKLLVNGEKELQMLDIYVASRTNNGADINSGSVGNTGVQWSVRINEVPVVTIPEGSKAFTTYYDKNFYNQNGVAVASYRYYCVALTAEYDEIIEESWPADVISEVSSNGAPFRFGSWSSPAGSVYRNTYGSDHSNIIGYYPTMSSDLMIDYAHSQVPVEKDEYGNEYGPIFYAWWGKNLPGDANIGYHAFENYYEAIDEDEIMNADPDSIEVIDGVTFIKNDFQLFHCAHNSTTAVFPFMYEGVTILPGEAHGYRVSSGPPHEERTITVTENGEPVETTVIVTKFHYTRKKHALYYESKGRTVHTVENVPYGQSLSKIYVGDDYVPPYPDTLEPGTHEFMGWYTSSQFFMDEYKVDWDAHTMPERSMVVYAYWKPKVFTVTFYNDESEYDKGEPLEPPGVFDDTYGEEIPHDVLEIAISELSPSTFVLPDGTVGHYRRVGWYYKVDGVEHAFDPETMTVMGDLQLYMKWTSEIPAFFTVNYTERSTGNKIGDTTIGYSFVGLTRTFTAKLDDQLYPVEGTARYYPYYSSMSVLMKPDPADNVLDMEYALRGNVPYKVRYVWVDENHVEHKLLEDKNVQQNNKCVVTEMFRHIDGYIPKKYYSTLTITVSDDYNDELETDSSKWNPANVITFYYTKDSINIPFHVKYMLEDSVHGTEEVNGVRYRQVNYIDDIGQRGETETEPIIDYPGYEPLAYKELVLISDGQGDHTVTEDITNISDGAENISFLLDEFCQGGEVVGKEVHIYYNKKKYPVKIDYTFTASIIEEEAVPQDGETQEQAEERVRQAAVAAAMPKVIEWYEKLEAEFPGILVGSYTDVVEKEHLLELTVYRIVEDQKFGEIFTDEAPDFEEYGFRYAGDSRVQSLVIGDDNVEPEHIARNRIEYFYTEIQYLMLYYDVVLPSEDGLRVSEDLEEIAGLLSMNQHNVPVGEAPVHPVTARDNDIYTFVGWYLDAECTEPAPDSYLSGENGNILNPISGFLNDTYFYARYDFRRGDLTITALPDSNDAGDPDKMNVFNNEIYEFIVRRKAGTDVQSHNDWAELRVIVNAGETKTIKSLPIGDYTVEQAAWSWRYEPDSVEKTVTVNENATAEEAAALVFREKLSNRKWLTGQTNVEN